MTVKINKLLTLCSGGDAPGMNAALRAIVRYSLHQKIQVYGTEMGYCGLMNENIFPLSADSVANIIMRGGTILKTGRCPEFKDKEERDKVRKFLTLQDIDVLIVLGGEGSFIGAQLLAEEGGPRVVGIPCTIDNDIVGTEYTIGFDTARNTALEAIDKIRDTAFSLERNFIIEVMGRSSGFLAVDVGIAGGAELILIPEFPITVETLLKRLQKERREKLGSLIVSAEAGKPNSSIDLAKKIKEKSGIEYKVCILGHIQRGGTPTVIDRKMGSLMGAKAVNALLTGHSKVMTAVENDKLKLVPFPNISNATRFFTNERLLRLNQIFCEI